MKWGIGTLTILLIAALALAACPALGAAAGGAVTYGPQAVWNPPIVGITRRAAR